MKPLRKRYIMKTLRAFVRPIEWIFASIACIAIAYALCLRFDVPQRILQAALEKLTPEAEVSDVSGFFPFSFHVRQIHLPPCEIEELHVLWSWRFFRFNMAADAVRKTARTTAPKSFTPIEPDATTTAVRAILNAPQKYATLKWIRKIRVQNLCIADPMQPLLCHIWIEPGSHPSMAIALQAGETKHFIKTSHLSIKNPSKEPLKRAIVSDFGYVQEKAGALASSADGQVRLTPQRLEITAHVVYNGQPARSGDLSIDINHSVLPDVWNRWNEKALAPPSTPKPFAKLRIVPDFLPNNLHLHAQLNTDFHALLRFSAQPTAQTTSRHTIGELHLSARPGVIALTGTYIPQGPEVPTNAMHFTGEITPTCGIIKTLKGTNSKGRILLGAPVRCDFTNHSISPITLRLGRALLKTSELTLGSHTAKQNRFSLGPWHMNYTSNEGRIHCGSLTMDGTIMLDKKGPDVLLHLHFGHKGCAKAQKTDRCLDAACEATCRLAADRIEIQSCTIKTAGGQRMAISKLKILPAAGSLLSYFKARRNKYAMQTDPDACLLLDGHITGDIDLGSFTAFLRNGDFMRGTLRNKLIIGGSLERLRLTGTADLLDGTYENIANGVVLKNIRFNGVAQDGALELKALRLIDGTHYSRRLRGTDFSVSSPPKGTAAGHGLFRLQTPDGNFAPWLEIALHCHYLQVAYSDLVKARASGMLYLKGPVHGIQGTPTITGDVRLDAMTINLSAATIASTNDANVSIVTKAEPTKASADPERFAINIKLTTGERVVVQGENGLTCFLRGSAFAKGPLDNPFLVGTLTADPARSNAYNLFGKIMTVKKGVVTYEAEHLNDPRVYIELSTRISGKDVWAVISGLTTATRITLRSNPPMSNEEILALLLFRQGLNELAVNQNLRVNAFSSQMLQNNPLGFFDKMRNGMGLDSLEVVETQDMGSGETVQTVRIGKQIKKVRVYVDKNLSTKNDSKMTVRYDLTPQLGIEANVSTDEKSSGIGVQWIKRY